MTRENNVRRGVGDETFAIDLTHQINIVLDFYINALKYIAFSAVPFLRTWAQSSKLPSTRFQPLLLPEVQ